MKVNKFALGFLFLCVLMLGSCAQNPSKMDSDKAKDIANKLTYIKDEKTKLCYATVASRQTADFQQNGLTITWVPCTPEVEAQIQK